MIRSAGRQSGAAGQAYRLPGDHSGYPAERSDHSKLGCTIQYSEQDTHDQPGTSRPDIWNQPFKGMPVDGLIVFWAHRDEFLWCGKTASNYTGSGCNAKPIVLPVVLHRRRYVAAPSGSLQSAAGSGPETHFVSTEEGGPAGAPVLRNCPAQRTRRSGLPE